MARIVNNVLHGKVGNLVYYSVNGKNYVRSKPAKGNSKPGIAQKNNRDLFGKISHLSALMRLTLKPYLLIPLTSKAHKKLLGYLFKIVAKPEGEWKITGKGNICQLNKSAELDNNFCHWIKITDRGNAVINMGFPEIIPVQQFKAAPGTTKVNMKVLAVSSSPDAVERPPLLSSRLFSFEYSSVPVPAHEIEFELKAQSGDFLLMVVAIELEREGGGVYLEQKWLPVAVVRAGRVG